MSALPKLPCAAALAAAFLATPAAAQDNGKPTPGAESEIARYCNALAPGAREARAAYQFRRLADLESEVRDEVEKLEAKESAAREWVTKRDSMMKSAPDAAASQLSALDEPVAAAVLAKLKPQAASAILAEMQADKAAKLSSLIAGAPSGDKS
jgi:flagellar motility protein MotE (MotC chaperone)